MRINATLGSVQLAKPAYKYGQLATVPLKDGEKAGLLRAAIPADIPDTAVITKAELVLHVRVGWSGSTIVTAQRHAESWSMSKATWNNRPSVVGGTDENVTVASPAAGDEFRIDVSDHVQDYVAGAETNRGWRIYCNSSTARTIYGSTAGKHKPWLDLEYVVPGDPPTDLVPDGGAVSIAKPTLTAVVADGVIAVQVRIDSAADSVSPDFTSAEVPATAGILNLAATAFGGLTLGATTYWQMRAKYDDGWTQWSSWATLPRIAKPTVTITGPDPTTGDKTPPIAWTAAGQTIWHARFLKLNGKVIDDSERVASNDHEWTPEKGLKRVGDIGRVHVRVWDDVDRVATPGDPIWAEAFLDTTLVAIDDAPGVDTLDATQDGPSPVVRLAWEGPASDLKRVTRDGEWIDVADGSDTGTYLDYTAAPLAEHVYQVLVATDDGLVSPNGPTKTIRTRPAGLFLMDPDADERILLLDEEVEVSAPERAVLHTPLGDAPPIRRRSGIPPPFGTASGLLLESDAGDDYDPAAMAAIANGFKDSDQGRVYRLAWGGWNIPVTIGDMTVAPVVLDDSGRRAFEVSFLWWQTGDELPWDD